MCWNRRRHIRLMFAQQIATDGSRGRRGRERGDMHETTTTQIQRCLDRMGQGDETAHRDLMNAASERLTRLTHKMFRSEERLRRWEETGDVLQNAMLRLM